MNKKEFRNHVKLLRKSYSKDDLNLKSHLIFENLERELCFINSSTLVLFWSMDDEVNTHDFIQKWHSKKTILLPVIHDDILVIKKFTGIENMYIEKRFGIYEPGGNEYRELENIDLIIVPGQAFDANKNRLGRGKGFYDKLLANNNIFKTGICYDFQIVESVPTNEFDIKMDLIISNSKILR